MFLELKFVDVGGQILVSRHSGLRLPRSAVGTFRLMDLEVNARLMLGSDHTQQSANGFGGLALPADDLAHVLWIEEKGEEYSHLVDSSLGLHVFGMINQSFYEIFNKFLVFFHIFHGINFIRKELLRTASSTLGILRKIIFGLQFHNFGILGSKNFSAYFYK